MRLLPRPLRFAALAALAIVAALLVGLDTAGAQEPQAPLEPRLEAQAQELERQLLCPQCTSKRVDVCDLPICDDMRRLIREQLAAGRAPEDILLFFRGRYGERVLADLPKEGFNLFLFGWVAASIAGVALLGGLYLYQLRRASRRRRSLATAGVDDDWLEPYEGRPR